MNLNESVRKWVLQALPYNRADADLITHLSGLDAHRLLVVYHNWMSRLIKPQPRRVRKSQAFLQNPLVAERANEFAQIIGDIEKGRDLRKYLSRGVKVAAAVPGKPFGKRRDLDLMLNAQGIHHLHISTQVEADGYVKRDGPLLFAFFKLQTAYLINVMRHGDWRRDHVLEVLAHEWPNEGLIHEIKGVIGLRQNHTDDERAILQKNGINTFVQIGDRIFMPAGGVTAAGTTVAASRAADQVLINLEAFEKDFEAHPERVKKAFAVRGINFPDYPEFEFIIHEHGYGVLERKTGTLINLEDKMDYGLRGHGITGT